MSFPVTPDLISLRHPGPDPGSSVMPGLMGEEVIPGRKRARPSLSRPFWTGDNRQHRNAPESPNSRKTIAPSRFVGPFLLHQGPISGTGVRMEKQRVLIVRDLGKFGLRLFGGNETIVLLWTRQDSGGHS